MPFFYYCIFQNLELFWQLAKTPRDLMHLPSCHTYISTNGYVLGWYRQNGSASPPGRLSVTGLQWPVWGHDMVAATSGNKARRTSHWDERSGVWEQLKKKSK